MYQLPEGDPLYEGLARTYGPQGLTVIGDHYPEFAYESDLENLREAVDRLGVTYPVAQDNDRETWDAYGVRYWLTLVLVDKNGYIRYQHIGEGAYAETETAIQALLDQPVQPGEGNSSSEPLRPAN